MRFVFFAKSLVPFHGGSLEERPLGGTETGVVRLAESLKKLGHQCVVYTNHKEPPPSTDPLYLHISQAQQMQPADCFIALREWLPLMGRLPVKKRFYWTGDAYDQPFTFGLGDKRVSSMVDAFLCVSEWQARTFSTTSGFPLTKCYLLKNGIHLPYFELPEQRARKRLIYSSTPYRGLEYLPAIFARIRQRHPEAELKVYSGFEVYTGDKPYDPAVQEKYRPLFEELRQTPGVELCGNVVQAELAKAFMQSSILAYPNSFAETSCITAMEAQAAGCAIVSSKLGALPETVGENGFLIEGKPEEPSYQTQFVEFCSRLLEDDQMFEGLSVKAKQRAQKEFSWDHVAQRFIAYLEKYHELR